MKFLVCILFSCFIYSQKYDKNYFKPPLDIPLTLSGNFGELRANHFHAGLDFRTNQKEGLNVYAAADGYVSRIKISTFGYGKAIYITHPNGFTTVYGHLKIANAEIQKYIISKHYQEKNYEIDVYPTPNELKVKQGEFIALSGNTGGSGGPHLHFEIRDSKTENTINPLYFGFDALIEDTQNPIINALLAYPIGGQINKSTQPSIINLDLQKDGTYLAQKVTTNGKIGFGINAYDLLNKSYGKHGIFKVEAFLNGKKTYGYDFSTFSFEEAKNINGLIDYQKYIKTGVRFQKLFMINPFRLSIIDKDENNGILDILPNLTYIYKIEISDFNNNKIVINVPITYQDLNNTEQKSNPKQYFLKSKIDNVYSKENVTVSVPANSFYEDFYLNFDVRNDTITFQDDSYALQNPIQFVLEKEIPEAEKSKTFLATLDDGKINYNKTKIKGKEISTYTKKIGKLVIAKDTTAPKITPVNIKNGANLNKQKTIQFNISDNCSGIDTYNGYINNKWALFEYDFKTKKLTHNLEDNIFENGNNKLKLIVTDNLGNTATFEAEFSKEK